MSTDDWADLARLAEAATPGPWEAKKARESDDHMITARSEHGHVWIANTAIPDDPTADAEFIAAANPATILRLVDALDSAGTGYMNARDLSSLYREERDALRARLAAVEALADVRNGAVHADHRDPAGMVRLTDLRAALDGAK